MGNGYVVPAQDALDQLRQILMDARARLRELEALDGSQIYNTVQDLRNLIDGLLNQVDGQSDAFTYLTRDQFFPIPAGGSCVVQFNAISTSSGSPMMTVTGRSGWW